MSDEKYQIFTEIGAMTAMIRRVLNLAEMVNDAYQLERVTEEVAALRESLQTISDNTSAIKEAPNE